MKAFSIYEKLMYYIHEGLKGDEEFDNKVAKIINLESKELFVLNGEKKLCEAARYFYDLFPMTNKMFSPYDIDGDSFVRWSYMNTMILSYINIENDSHKDIFRVLYHFIMKYDIYNSIEESHDQSIKKLLYYNTVCFDCNCRHPYWTDGMEHFSMCIGNVQFDIYTAEGLIRENELRRELCKTPFNYECDITNDRLYITMSVYKLPDENNPLIDTNKAINNCLEMSNIFIQYFKEAIHSEYCDLRLAYKGHIFL